MIIRKIGKRGVLGLTHSNDPTSAKNSHGGEVSSTPYISTYWSPILFQPYLLNQTLHHSITPTSYPTEGKKNYSAPESLINGVVAQW